MKPVRHNSTTQHGAALLVLFLIIFAVSATVFLSSVNTNTVEIRRHQDMRAEMEKAKQALIAYAINYPGTNFDYVTNTTIMDEGPGRLLCPDVDAPDILDPVHNLPGFPDSNAADCPDYKRGRLPQRYSFNSNLVEINDTFANIDQQFWYVVSPTFKEITTTGITHQTAGTLSIDGVSGYVAVIIAPGEALANQNRAASQTTASNYLEAPNDDLTGTNFINYYPVDPNDPYAPNDQVIGIKASELMLETIKGDFGTTTFQIYEPIRQDLYAYWIANSSLPASLKNTGLGWRYDEGYHQISVSPLPVSGYYRDTGYPYIRYNINGCSTYWYWFIPVSPYSPNNTYASGTPC